MEFGAHLPLMDFGGNPCSLEHLTHYTTTVEGAGFAAISVNDHLVFAVPWLDGPTALAAVLDHTGTMDLATTVVLPAVRGPVVVAKTFAAIDRLSGGRVVLAVGPGSSPLDYAAVGPEHAFYQERGRTNFTYATDDECLNAFQTLAKTEGIIPALESSHALAHGMKLAKSLPADKQVLINLSGRGDKDVWSAARAMGVEIKI